MSVLEGVGVWCHFPSVPMFLWECIISLTVWSHVPSWVGGLCSGRFTAAVATARCQFQGCGCMMPLPVWSLVLSWGSLFRGLYVGLCPGGSTAAVATIRCQYQGYGCMMSLPVWSHVLLWVMGVWCHFLWPHVLSGGWSLSRGGSALLLRIDHGTDHTSQDRPHIPSWDGPHTA